MIYVCEHCAEDDKLVGYEHEEWLSEHITIVHPDVEDGW